MAAVDRWHIWKAGTEMSLPDHLGRLPARSKKVPVRVKLERINCDVGKLHPPDGDRQTWIDRRRRRSARPQSSSSMRPCISFRPRHVFQTVECRRSQSTPRWQ
jgi:hypothetical protein